VSERLMRCIIENKGPTYIASLAEDAGTPLKKLIRKEGLKSMLAAPLIVGDDFIGVMMICTKKARHFHGTDIKIFNALARQSALAIANIGLYDRMDKKAKDKIGKIAMLFEMSRSFSSAIELDMVLDIILEKAGTLLKAKFCVLKLLNKSRKKLIPTSFYGLTKGQKTAMSGFDDEIAKKAMSNGAAFVVNDVNTYFKAKVPAFLKETGARSILGAPLFSNKRKAGVLLFYIPEVRIFEKEDIGMAEMVASFLSMVIDNTAMLERIRKDYLNTIKTLAKIIDANDPYTAGHCEKVKKYSMIICKEMKLPSRHVNAIKTASILHDIGKIGIDVSVLRKTEKLTEEDWQKIKLHPEIGARIVSQIGFMNEIVPIVKYHHSRFNGGGYPDPKKQGAGIPIGARVLAVADAYDAMTSERPYRKAMSKEEALNELKSCAGLQFDPEVVGAFLCKEL